MPSEKSPVRRNRIKGHAAAAVACAALFFAPCAIAAGDANGMYAADEDHPLKIAYYFLDPVGRALQYAVTDPMARLAASVAPYWHIDTKGFNGCSRERPARSCAAVIK
ncbi:MAG TPA: hypothetical protein VGK20_02725 [Candidatus Binatia bacterium]|jgi:hypothetical protein